MVRTLEQIREDEQSLRKAIQLMMIRHGELVDEYARRKEIDDILSGKDQICSRCGKVLEKRRLVESVHGWKCLECVRELRRIYDAS